MAAPVATAPVVARAEHNASDHKDASSPQKSQKHSSDDKGSPSGKPSPSASNKLEETGSVSKGATATLSADTPKGTCELDNALSPNQQAGWTESVVNTCCTKDQYSTCWWRAQAKASPEDACKIPNCDDLFSNEHDKMLGFRPLTSTTGMGKYGNTFPILFLSAAARPSIHLLLFIIAPLSVSLLLLL